MTGNRRTRNQQLGSRVEELALARLRRAGLRLLARNFRCRGGEIDLIMRDGATIVFVEVRHRGSNRYGSAAESIGQAKRRRLRHTALRFLALHGLLERHPCRFDCVTSDAEPCDVDSLQWTRSAFGFEE